METSILALAVAAIAGFAGINLAVAELPPFLKAENAAVAALLSPGAVLVLAGRRALGIAIIGAVSLFYAGRVSRSVVSPTGSLVPLWEAHLPVVLLLLLAGLLSLVSANKGSSSQRGPSCR